MLNQGKEISARDFDIYHPSSLIYWTNNINNTIQFARLTSDGIGIMLGSIGLRDDQGQLKMDIVPDQIKIGSKTGQIIFTNSCGGRHPCELIYKVLKFSLKFLILILVKNGRLRFVLNFNGHTTCFIPSFVWR